MNTCDDRDQVPNNDSWGVERVIRPPVLHDHPIKFNLLAPGEGHLVGRCNHKEPLTGWQLQQDDMELPGTVPRIDLLKTLKDSCV